MRVDAMFNRSANSVVTFQHPFVIGAENQALPAGDYNLTIEEELVESLSFPVFRRISTVLEVPAIGAPGPVRQYLNVSADDIDDALRKDLRRPGPGAG